MRVLAMGVIVAALCSLAPAAAQSGSQAHFTAGDVAMTMPIPDHYCTPTAQQAEQAAFASSLGGSPTILTLPSCGPGKSGQDYYVIKWISSVGSADLDQILGHNFDRSRAPIPIPAAEKEIGAALTAHTGTPTSVATAMAPDGRDETCGYMTGTMTFAGAKPLVMTMAACITVVGKRALEVIRYVPGAAPERIPELKRVVRQIALTIHRDTAAEK